MRAVDVSDWVIERLDAADRGLHDVWVGDDGSAVLAGVFVVLQRTGRGPWERVPIKGKYVQLQAVDAIGPLRVAVGYPHTMLISRDGGAKWSNKACGAKSTLKHVVCASPTKIVACGDDGTFVSDDGGKSFETYWDLTRAVPVALGERVLVAKLEFKGPNSYGVLRDLATETVVSSVEEGLDALCSVGSALIAANNSAVLRSTDAGVTWTKVLEVDKLFGPAIASNAAGRVVVVGYHGFVAISDDAGITWRRETVSDRDLRGVFVTPTGGIWIVGNDGVLARSRDEAVSAPTTLLARTVAHDPDVGRVVRPASTIPVWTSEEPAAAPIHTSIVTAAAVIDASHFVTADADGKVILSTREGDAWGSREVFAASSTVTSLAIVGARIAIAHADAIAIIDLASASTPLPSNAQLTVAGARLMRARGDILAVATRDAVELWNVALDARIGRVECTKPVEDIDLSPDGTQLTIAAGEQVSTYDMAGRQQSSFRRKEARVRYARDGKELFLATDKFDVRVVSAAKGGARREVHTGDRPRSIEVSAGGAMLATMSVSDELAVAELAHEELLLGWAASPKQTLLGTPRELPPHEIVQRVFSRHRILALPETAAVTALAVGDDGLVIAGDVSGEVAIFDARRLGAERAGTPRSTHVQPALEAPLFDLPIIADGRDGADGAVFLGADARVRFVDIATGEIRLGPRLEVTGGGTLYAVDDVLVLRGNDGWTGFDRATGAPRWTANFSVREPVVHGRAIYGFESRSQYAHGVRVGHALYRLDVASGAVIEVAIEPPPGAVDADGYASWITPTKHGFLTVFHEQAPARLRGVRLDPETGAASDGPLEIAGTAPWFHLASGAATVSPSGRYLAWSSDDGITIRDGDDPTLPVVTTSVAIPNGVPLVEHGRIVSVAWAARAVRVFDLAGASIATMSGTARLAGHFATIYAATNARAFLTVSKWDATRRWPLP